MRALLVIGAGVLAISGCASLTTVDKTPDRKTVEALLLADLACEETEGEEAKCRPEKQPTKVRLSEIDCKALPLRSGVREAAHAVCALEGEVRRADGTLEALERTTREFSLIDLTPGAYAPTRDWTIAE